MSIAHRLPHRRGPPPLAGRARHQRRRLHHRDGSGHRAAGRLALAAIAAISAIIVAKANALNLG